MAGVKLTNDFGKAVLERFTSTTPTRSIFKKFKIGSGTTGPTVTDTDLGSPVPVGREVIDGCDVITGWTASSGLVLAVEGTIYKTSTGAIDMTKTSAGGSNVNMYKTASATYDFTSKELNVWFYIIDATALAKFAVSNCIELRWGSDASNYYSWTKDYSDLSVGWNRFQGLTSATATTVGTPVLTACDYIYVSMTTAIATSVFTEGDIIVDDIKQLDSDDYFIDEVSGYPLVDMDTLQVTHRSYISSTQSNGYSISETGLFNEDGTPLLGTRSVFSSISKDENDEFIFIFKNRLRINETTS